MFASVHRMACVLAGLAVVVMLVGAASAEPLITGLVENNRNMAVPAGIRTSATHPSPSGTSAELKDEAFVFVNRTHEYTAVRTDANGLLTTNPNGTLQPFPSYLIGAEYIQLANENRTQNPYSLDVTLSQPVIAYLFLDNRLNGPGLNNTSSNTTDPVLGGVLQWVIDDGWVRVNTGFMPNGQADYLGVDEGGTVADESLRVHTGTGLVAGSGNGLNQFFAIYTKQFPAGTHIGFTKTQGITGNMYGVAVVPVPEPSTMALLVAGLLGLFWVGRQR